MTGADGYGTTYPERAEPADTRSEVKQSLNQFSKELERKRAQLEDLMRAVRTLESDIELLSSTTGSLEKALSAGQDMPSENGRMAAYR